MFIINRCLSNNFSFFNNKASISCTYGGPHAIKVVMKKPSDRLIKKKEGTKIDAVISSRGYFKANSKVEECFLNISKNELPKNMLCVEEFERFYSDRSTTVEKLPIKYFPQSFQDYIKRVRSELGDLMARSVNIYRWRCGLRAKHNNLFGGDMTFSFDGKKWFMAPHGLKIHFSPMYSISDLLKNM